MNQRKPNSRTWYLLGFTALLCIVLLVTATGTAFARYRAEREAEIKFKVRVPDQVHLGTVTTVTDPTSGAPGEVFTPDTQLSWETKNGVTQLRFAVANGNSETDFSARDQRVRLRMIGTLGVWDGTQTTQLSLILPALEEGGEERIVTATVTPFIEGTALQLTYGDGWLYTFLDEEGEEIYWELPGGELSYVTLTVAATGEVPENLNLLQPYVTAEAIQD